MLMIYLKVLELAFFLHRKMVLILFLFLYDHIKSY